jgi:diketogulonate reductase-like aldo/keto reductase
MTTTRTLNDGTSIPLLGLGVWQVPNGPECVDAVVAALESGYRHIDTAQAYENEESVGEGIRKSGVPRDEIYITTKFFPRRGRDPVAEAERSLQRLGVDHVDLYLVHWPEGGPTWMWEGMERARELGHTRSIGVSNYGVEQLDELLGHASVQPAADQIRFNPFDYRRTLLESAEGRGIAIEAYSPLGTGKHLGDETVGAVAERVGRTPAQVLIRWCLQRGTIVLPKSTHRERIEQNGQVFDFELSDEDMAELDALDRTGGASAALESTWW